MSDPFVSSRSMTVLGIFCLALAGAGCFSNVSAPSVAEPLVQYETPRAVDLKQGFGQLPSIPLPQSRATVRLLEPIPDLPAVITVLRLKRGTPNDTELLNLASAIELPGNVLSNKQSKRELMLEWTDESFVRWTYRASRRLLEFSSEIAPAGPLTVSSLPANDRLAQTASAFLQNHGIDLAALRVPLVEPDWNLWWAMAKAERRCMDQQALAAVRAVAASASLLAGGPPGLPESTRATCLSPEFPARLTVRYHQLTDNRDVIDAGGAYVNGAEIVVDASRLSVLSGRMTLYADPDRSDYPALTLAEVEQTLLAGGLSGASGDVAISSYDTVYLRLEDAQAEEPTTYLVPSLLAFGTRTRSDMSTEPFRIVVPLLAR